MSQSDQIEEALDLLQSIKDDDADESAAVQQSAPTAQEDTDDPLIAAREEVDRLYGEHDLSQYLDRDNLSVGIAKWEGRNGVCKYNYKLRSHIHGKRMSGNGVDVDGHHTIVINERIWNDGNEEKFHDTVRHELAHAVVYEMHGTSQKHNHNWKALAAKLGADPSSCHNKHDTEGDYLYGCPSGCWVHDKKRRSKKIKKPWQGSKPGTSRFCKQCEATPVAWDRGKERPEEPGTVNVEGIPWSNKQEYLNHPTKEIN